MTVVKFTIKKGATSQILHVPIEDTASKLGRTGLAWNTASLAWTYIRPGGTGETSVTLATQTIGTWATGGFVEVDATNMPGVYEIGVPDACLATGADRCVLYIGGSATTVPTIVEIDLVTADLAGSALPYVDGSQRVDVGKWLGTAVTTDGTVSKPDVNVNAINGVAAAASYLSKSTQGIVAAQAAAGTLTTTAFTTNLTEATDDHYNGRTVLWYGSSALAGQSATISDYNGTTKLITVSAAMTEAPSAADTFVIV